MSRKIRSAYLRRHESSRHIYIRDLKTMIINIPSNIKMKTFNETGY